MGTYIPINPPISSSPQTRGPTPAAMSDDHDSHHHHFPDERGSASPPAPAAHRFRVKTYTSPTFCDLCHKLLWGIVRQGVCCSKCHVNSHFRCMKEWPACTEGAGSASGPGSPGRPAAAGRRGSGTRISGAQLSARASVSSTRSIDEHAELAMLLAAEAHAEAEAAENLARAQAGSGAAAAAAATDAGSSGGAGSGASTPGCRADSASPSTPNSNSKSKSGKSTPESSNGGTSSSKKNLASMVNEILVSTSKHAARMERQRSEPGLNLLTTTPKNMTRFVARAGVMRAAEAHARRVLAWENKTLTLLVLAVYTLLCLYPLALVVAPQALAAYHLAVQYYEHTKSLQQQTLAGADAKRRSKHARPPKIDLDPAPKLRPAEYKENLQYIQNFMGVFSDVYDTVVLFARQYLSWDCPENAATVLRLVASSIVPTFLVFYYVPLAHLALAAGWAVFLGNTPLALAMRETLTPVLLDLLNENWEFAKGVVRRWPEMMKVKPGKKPARRPSYLQQPGGGAAGASAAAAASVRSGVSSGSTKAATDAWSAGDSAASSDGVYMVAIYENQRWWLGLGFLNYMLTSERAAWSDYSGAVPLPPRASYAPPPDFVFLEDDWQVDRAWSLVEPDADGWVYSDHVWANAKSAAGVGSLTRRRKWVRRVARRADVPPAAGAAAAATAPSSCATAEIAGAALAPHSGAPASSGVPQANAADGALQVPSPPESAAASPRKRALSNSSQSTLYRDGACAPVAPTAAAAAAEPAAAAEQQQQKQQQLAPAVKVVSAPHAAGTAAAADDAGSNAGSDEVEYILEVDGEEIVLENVRSLDQVDMDRLREMVRSLKQQQQPQHPQVPMNAAASSAVNAPPAQVNAPPANAATTDKAAVPAA